MRFVHTLPALLCLPLMSADAAELISVNAAGDDAGNASSYVPSEEIQPFGDGGNLIVFASGATDLVAIDGNGATDVFLRDRAAGTTELVSVNAAGDDSANGSSSNGSISEDGRYVVFFSNADDLSALADSNGAYDLFIRDRQTGVTRMISKNAAGNDSGDMATFGYAMTADAAWIVFHSDASDLVDSDNNGASDVFLYSRATDDLVLVSKNQAGTDTGGGESTVVRRSAISADGRWIVYQSRAADLVAGDANGNQDVFLYDAQNEVNRRISLVPGGGAGGNGDSDNALISADGSRVVMRSAATDLTADDDTNGVHDFYAWDAASDSIELVTINAAGDDSGSGGTVITDPRISDDGRYLVFESNMTDLTAIADNNGTDDMFLRDLVDDKTTLVTTNAAGDESANGQPDDPQISGDGRFVYYETQATDVAATPDGNGQKDSYVWDRSTGTNYLITVNGTGSAAGDDFSYDPLQSRDGRFVEVDSRATDLVDGGTDSNGATDVYVFDLAELFPELQSNDVEEEDDDSSSTAWSPLVGILLAPALLAGFARRRRR